MLHAFANTREKRLKLNIIVSIPCQLLTILCGIIIPRLLIGQFGSEAYGATASISQFLAYIALLEGGIGGVARAALYKPLAENDYDTISKIVFEIRRFFRVIAYIFIVYVLILASSFKMLSHIQCFDWFNTFMLVIVISISIFSQYFIGLSCAVLLQASQRTYIVDIISIITIILNTLLVIFLIKIQSSLIMVKFISSCVFLLRPIMMQLYIKHQYALKRYTIGNWNYLNQKWSGLGQHLAYFLYSNTDVVVLTLLADLKTVAVYSIYNMIIVAVHLLVLPFSSGMEALFGNLYARKEQQKLAITFDCYETMISTIVVVIYSVTAVLIIPFVSIYTSGIYDVNYIEPIFALILTISSATTCLRWPYQNMTIAAGHFVQTSLGAYGEAMINIMLSILLVTKFGLVGVAIGTLTATLFRRIYYAYYLSSHIINRDIRFFWKRETINIINAALIYILGTYLLEHWPTPIDSYFNWTMIGLVITIFAICLTLGINIIYYHQDIKQIVAHFHLKIRNDNVKDIRRE